ncbi:MAG: shikimate kinase [Candidatus Eremiobacteraeota bacterium]|nr:shikimate kinase [Candidatus Eremiobacteraeota bacterium]
MRNHLALVGFMAAGKSTVGKRLARKLKLPFVDIDEVIEREHGPIADIFYSQGEPAFRQFEHDTIARAVSAEPSVLALGGGAATFPATLKLLKKHTYRVFIKVPVEVIAGRLAHSPRVRPLLGPHPSVHRIRELYEKRSATYANADLTITADHLRAPQIADHIVEWMHRKKLTL